MAPETTRPELKLHEFLHPPEVRVDRWRTLNRVARSLANGEAPETDPNALLAELSPLEDFCAYPGPRLLAQVSERLHAGDHSGLARLVQRISNSLLSGSYREDPESWMNEEEGETHLPEILPPSLRRGQTHRPFFELLFVSPGERSTWADLRDVFRRLRRPGDQFVYEPRGIS